jgi:hypothetical protein
MRFGFAAHQERFHLSAAMEGGLTTEGFEALEARLAHLGARGILLRLDREELLRRLAGSLIERPSTWAAWLQRRYGGIEGAAEAFLEQQNRLQELAQSSRLTWVGPPG